MTLEEAKALAAERLVFGDPQNEEMLLILNRELEINEELRLTPLGCIERDELITELAYLKRGLH